MVKTPNFLDHDFAELLLPEGPELLPEVSDQLNAVLARLRVFSVSQANAPPQPIDVSFHLRNYEFTTGNNRLLSAIVLCVNSSRASASFPQFRIRSLVPGGTQFYYETQIDGFFDLLRTMAVPIDHFYFFGFGTANSREKTASWLKALLHMDDRGIQGGVTSVSLLRANANDVEALMSALPFARSTHSINYSTRRIGQDDTFEQIDLPWLAYAIFHPHTTASSWCHLKLTDLRLTEHSTHVLTAMARGNNLLAVLSGTPPTSDAYYRAQLTPGTVVEREPCWTIDGLVSRGMQDKVLSAPLGESTPTTVDVCGIASLDSTTWSEWVQVIAPAYGLGWVRTSELQNVRAHKPSESGLWGLRLCRRYNFGGVPDDQSEALLHVLRPLGAMLTFLDVSEYNDLAASTMGDILRACPRLKTLIASHNGDLWSDTTPRIAPFETALEALELRLPSGRISFSAATRDHIEVSLRSLQAIRFQVWASTGPTGDQPDGTRATAASCHHAPLPALAESRLDIRTVARPIGYNDTVEWTPTALTQLGLTDDKYLFAHRSLSPTCVAAFLSVVARESDVRGSALGRLTDRGVLTNILEFAASPVRRFLFIEPNNKQPVEDTQYGSNTRIYMAYTEVA